MIQHITVLGAGTMGYGFALDFARHGFSVNLVDITEKALQKGLTNLHISLQVFHEEGLITQEAVDATLANITTYTDLGSALSRTDMVIEALPEVLAIKQKTFAEVDILCPNPKAIFVSNSSSLKLSDVCAHLPPARKKYAVMAHYFNPPEIMPLVELLSLPETSEELMQDIRNLYIQIGKVPVRIRKEVAGLSANRIQMAVWREIVWQVENGIADTEDLNMVLSYGPAFRWATTGALTMLDMTGIDILRNIGDNLLKELDDSKTPAALVCNMVDHQELGLKSGKGFFAYPKEQCSKVKDAYVRRLVRQLKASKSNMQKTIFE